MKNKIGMSYTFKDMTDIVVNIHVPVLYLNLTSTGNGYPCLSMVIKT